MSCSDRSCSAVARTLSAALAACALFAAGAAAADQGGPDDGEENHLHHHHHGVVLQPGTRIADAALRSALAAYDPSTGDMRFARAAGAERLRPGQVLVSEPSAAAPFGYLRRITGVTHAGGEVRLTSVPARLNEAIKDAHATVTLILPTDGSNTPTLVPGPLVLPAAAPISAAGIGTDRSLDLDHDEGGVSLHLHGHERAWVGVNVGVDIDAKCFFDGDPCFSFDAEAGEQAETSVTLTGGFDGSFNQGFELYSHTFDVIVFFIGPVPVVLVPKLVIRLDFDGTAHGTFSYAASAHAPSYRMSVHWDSANGFSNGFTAQPAGIEKGSIALQAEVDVRARLPTRMELKLYDVAGINATVAAGLDAKLHIPHKPRWSVDGFLTGEIGVNADLPIIGDLGSTETTLFNQTFHIDQSPNSPPRISVVTPVAGQQINASWPDFGRATLLASTGDDEDGTPCCAVQWLLSDGTVLAQGNDLVAQLPHAGHFDLFARATDSDGASTDSAPVGIDVLELPPGAGIVLPGVACEDKIYTNLPVRLLGRDGEFIGANPYTCVWLSADGSQFGEELAGSFDRSRGCEFDTLFPAAGVQTLTLSAVAIEPDGTPGQISTATKTLRVRDPPAGPIPLLYPPGPAACEEVGLDAVLGQLRVDVLNTDLATTTWSWQAGGCAPVPLPAHALGGVQCRIGEPCPSPWQINGAEVAAITPASCGGDFAVGTVTITATDTTGAHNSTRFSIRLFDQIVH